MFFFIVFLDIFQDFIIQQSPHTKSARHKKAQLYFNGTCHAIINVAICQPTQLVPKKALKKNSENNTCCALYVERWLVPNNNMLAQFEL